MSDLKNVLKAGFLVTASLLATGCGDDNKDKPNQTTPNNGGGNGGGNGSGGGGGNGVPVTVTKPSKVPTYTINVIDEIDTLYKNGYAATTMPKAADGAKDGLGKDYDIFANLNVDNSQALGVVVPKVSDISKSILKILDYKSTGDESFLLKGDSEASNSKKVGSIFFDGYVDDKSRSVLQSKAVGNIDVDVLVLRNAVINAESAAKITAAYTYVGTDAAIGYPYPRQKEDGTESKVSNDVHSMPTTAASLGLFNSKAKQQTKADPKKTVGKAQEKVLKQPQNTGSATGVLTLSQPNSIPDKLTKLGLDITKDHGIVDLGGRIHTLNSSKVLLSSNSEVQPQLEVLPTIKSQTETREVPKLKNSGTSLGLFGKKSMTTKESVAQKEKESDKATTGQTIHTEGSVTKFAFKINEEGLFPEIGTWNVGTGTLFGVIAHHSLVVHDLNLNEDLSLKVLAEEHTFIKTKAANIADLGDGQPLFESLSINHGVPSIEYSDEVTGATEAEAKVKSRYAHFDSHMPFPLWVIDATVTSGKKLVLSGVDLAKAGVLEEAVYVMPLAKDFAKKLPDSASAANEKIALALKDAADANLEVSSWKVAGNGYFDKVLLIQVAKKTPASASSLGLSSVLMSSKAQGRRSVASSKLDAVVAKLDPSNLVSASLANIASTHANQASQFATMARGSNAATSAKLGAVEQYAVSFNHEGVQFGLTYNLNGGNAFTSNSGTTAIGANVATNVLGLKAIVSAEASVDAGKNALVSTSVTSYNAGLTFAKAYNAAGLSVVPMAGFGVSSNAFSGYSAIVPMAYNALGLSMNNVSFSTATFHAGVNLALDDFVAKASGVNASLTLGVAGYLAANANAKLSTNEGASKHIAFEGSSATPYAQFNLGFATGETLNALISTGSVAVNFGFDR